MELTVIKHAIPVRSENGKTSHSRVGSGNEKFSELQWQLRKSDSPVRIAEAPTGAGKSFVFRCAVKQDNARVLFIVPTRRLAQNMLDDMCKEFERDGLSKDQIERRVCVWSKDQTMDLRAKDPDIRIKAIRMNEAQSLAPFGRGDMIIAIPETISYLLTDQRNILGGNSRFSIFDLMAFDHIVFDEFHTIEPRGFGLAAMFAYFASRFRESFPARVSFLSATPLHIRPVLEGFGVSPQHIRNLSESENLKEGDKIAEDCRAIHGDVRLRMDKWDSMLDAVEEYASEILRQKMTVIIYNALMDLRDQRSQLEHIFEQMGIAPENCLLINSIDDTDSEYIEPGRFAAGRTLDPRNFKVLIATSSVEMGVNFDANLLLMEPGFEPLNFLQRYGRAARGNVEGQVVVRADDRIMKRKRWLKLLWRWMEEHDGKRVSIRNLTEKLTESVQKRFRQKIVHPESADTGSPDTAYFGQLPGRAVYTAGLYYHVVENHWAIRKGDQKIHFSNNRPASAKTIWSCLQNVRGLDKLPFVRNAADQWCKAFENEALKLRNIGASVRVIEDINKGREYQVQELYLQCSTVILKLFPVQFRDNGEPEVRIPGRFDDFRRDKREYVEKTITVLFPHTSKTATLPDNYEIVHNWCRLLRDPRGFMATQDSLKMAPKAMRAAESLVRMTGLIVSDDTEPDAESGVM
ncbi:DEAD/DEAH box helicase [Desulfococcaceae bacterium HSG8]|nr:DEAD/DEAH box helicase [Desulfococcaceae bacterium HSG8]